MKADLAPPPKRERKPTERLLNALIASYARIYTDASRAATDAAIEVLRGGGSGARLVEAREAYLRELLPILDALEAIGADAVRIGASRRWDPRARREDLERLVHAIVPVLRRDRELWLRKMASDFMTRVVMPVVEEDASRSPGVEAARASGMHAAPGEPLPRRLWVAVKPGDFTLGDPDRTFAFSRDTLARLLQQGYRFARLRVVEATEYDVWTGDDAGYIEASREDGVQEFVWRTSEDALVCPVCEALDGERYSPAEALQASRDRGEHTHCRCRCWFEAVEAAGA